MYTFPDDVVFNSIKLVTGRRLLELTACAIPDGVSVFDNNYHIRKSSTFVNVFGFVPLAALVGELGSDRAIRAKRHYYALMEFAASFERYVLIGQSSLPFYARVVYNLAKKRYDISAFFQVDVHDVSR